MDERGSWMRRTVARLGVYVAVVLLATPLAALAPPWGVVAYLAAVTGATAVMLRRIVRTTSFRCPECDTAFVIDAATFAKTPHMLDRKLLPCPTCGAGRWCVAGPRDPGHPTLDARPAVPPDRRLLGQLRLVLLSCLASWLTSLVVLVVSGPPPAAMIAIPVVALAISVALVPVYRYAARQGLRSPVYTVVTGLVVSSNLVLAALALVPLAT